MKMNGRWLVTRYSVFSVIMALLLVTSIGLPGCEKEGPPCAEKESPNEIVLGVLLPLTGDLSSSGETANASLEIAARDVNQYLYDVGFEIRVKLIVENTNTDPKVAKEKLGELADKCVKVVIGPGSSAEVKAVAAVAKERGILVISHSSTAPSLTFPRDNVFRFVPDDTHQGEAIAKMMWGEGRRAVIPMWRGDVWGDGLFKETKSSFEKLGGRMIDGKRYSPTSEDFSEELKSLNSKLSQAIKQYGVDSVAVQLIAFKEVEIIFTQAQNYPSLSRVKWYGSDGTAINKALTSNKQAAQFAARAGFPNPIVSEFITDKSELIKKQIRKRIKRDPNIYALVAYDVLWIVTKAYLATGKKTCDALKKAVRQEAKQYTGITGWTFLTEAGDRKFGNYDFWSVVEENGTFKWKRTAIYRISPILPGKVIYLDKRL